MKKITPIWLAFMCHSKTIRIWGLQVFLLVSSALALSQSQSSSPSAGGIYKKASPAVVLIETYNEKGEVSKSGSGFLITSDGEILTNYHVIAHAKRATVRLANQDAYDTVEVLDIDKRKDIALIKIKAVSLPYLALGQSSTVEVGETVLALSNPLGVFQNTLSQGIVSGIRQGDGYRYFQITAPISHGSSGAPIFNGNGEVIGIAVAALQEGQNLNFAIPIDYAKGMLSSNQPRPLASVYEPEPEAAETPTTAKSADRSSVPEEMRKSSALYLESKLKVWTVQDAGQELGEPLRHRLNYDRKGTVVGDIYAYPDPTRLWREFELDFDSVTKKLVGVYGHPWNMTWEQCKQSWGSDVTTTKNKDGTRVYTYRRKRLIVWADKHGNVGSVGGD